MCPHTTIYVPSYYFICVLMLLYIYYQARESEDAAFFYFFQIFTTRHVRVRALRAGSVVVELGIAREAGDVQQVVRILHISTSKASKAY
jgi:hypothetical protein